MNRKVLQTRVRQASKKPIKKLLEVVSNKSDRIVTGINEFDRVMGGGIVKDSISIITARPGQENQHYFFKSQML